MKTTLIALAFAALIMPLHAAKGAGGAGGKKKADPQAAFNRKDKDGNGLLSKKEFLAGADSPAKAKDLFKKKDKDHSGMINRAEFKGTAKTAKKKSK